VLTAVLGLLLGWAAAGRAVHAGVREDLRAAGRALTLDRDRQRVQRSLVMVQVALGLTLLVGSVLMARSFRELRRADPGFDARDVLTFEVVLPYLGYETYERSAGFQLALLERLGRLPGVRSAGAVSGLPMTRDDAWDGNFPYPVEVFGRTATLEDVERRVRVRMVTPGYLETMRTRVVEGRAPAASDRARDGAPVLVSASLAARLFPGESALGRRIRRGTRTRSGDDQRWSTVIGVVADVHEDGVAEPPPEVLYVPVLDAAVDDGFSPGYLTFALRTAVPPTSLVPAVRSVVTGLDPKMPIAHVRTMEDIVAADTAATTFTMLLLLVAAASALFLAAIGIYGVLSYAVGQRRREIGLRVALGARSDDVVRLVAGEAVALTATGLLGGTVAAALLTRFLRTLLFGVSPTDPVTFAATIALLAGVAVQPGQALAEE